MWSLFPSSFPLFVQFYIWTYLLLGLFQLDYKYRNMYFFSFQNLSGDKPRPALEKIRLCSWPANSKPRPLEQTTPISKAFRLLFYNSNCFTLTSIQTKLSHTQYLELKHKIVNHNLILEPTTLKRPTSLKRSQSNTSQQ